MTDSSSITAAVVVFLGCTAAMLGLTLTWATANRRPVRAHARLTGRAAAPYWYTPTGLADERGIQTRQ
ncbi:MAG TPA: hypothetical protein VHV82_18255 [Sporichthyaceae bacterium]|jgi:hypothetical protein|nr:hypothetical protein [Sporichthyaceae bacterium]